MNHTMRADTTLNVSVMAENERLNAARQLQDYYRLENLRELRLRPMNVAVEQTHMEMDAMRNEKKKVEPETGHFVAFWVFSCSRINNCIAITAVGITFICMSAMFFIVAVCYRIRKSKRFSPDEWWCEQHQQTRQPLLLVDRSMLKDDVPQEQQINSEELYKLKKYLKKYMSMNERTKEPKADAPAESTEAEVTPAASASEAGVEAEQENQ